MRVIFAGTPEFAIAPLQALASEHQVVAVYTQPDRRSGRGKKVTPPPVKVQAQKLGISVFQPLSLKDQVDQIRSFNADVMVVVAYGMLLPQTILDTPKLGCINIHASLLPRWRGAAPIQRAIEAGDQKTGVSIMRMELGLDTGPVFQSLNLDIGHTDTSQTLHDRLSRLGAKAICDTLSLLERDPNLRAQPQDDSLSNYAKKIDKAEAQIDWARTAQSVHQQMRAFIPWPVCQTHHQGTRLRIWQAEVVDLTHNAEPGAILEINDTGIVVACAQQALSLQVLQRDGSKPINSIEFCNGYTIRIGDKLGLPEKTAE